MARLFSLSKSFIEPYKTRIVQWGPVGEVTFKRTYARRVPEENRTEHWWETCVRVIEGMFSIQKSHCLAMGLDWQEHKAQQQAQEAFERLFVFKWLPPGRGLWMMGTDYVDQRGGAALNNCAFKSTKNPSGKTFGWIMDALMLGIGVGFDTKGKGAPIYQPKAKNNTIAILDTQETIYNEYYSNPNTNDWLCVIADSREGWVESVRVLLDAYYTGCAKPTFIYNKIRKAGEIIHGFGGTASGPEPLRILHNCLEILYNNYITSKADARLIVDTQNMIGRCVVAGNVRRSAALALGDSDDTQFLSLKDPLLWPYEVNEYRWGSNNSINAKLGMSYKQPVQNLLTNGEPGFIWMENAKTRGRFVDPPTDIDSLIEGFNPCVEMGLEDEELCTLVETFAWLHDSYEDFQETLKIAYLYAKSVTLTKTHWPRTNSIMLRNRRIGTSVSGLRQAVVKFGYFKLMKYLDQGYNYLTKLDQKYSNWLCVPLSKKRTTIKPSGTVPLLNGSLSGAHWAPGEYIIRRIVFANNDTILDSLRAKNYRMEASIYYPDSTVVDFPVKYDYVDQTENDTTIWEQLAFVADLQKYWSDNGVSVTIKFDQNEIKQIEPALNVYQDKLKAVSFLPKDNKHYRQLPFESITKEAYESYANTIIPGEIFSDSEGVGEKYCDGDKCVLPSR